MKHGSFRKSTVKSFFVKISVVLLASLAVTSLASSVIYAQATNPWNIQRNTTNNDLDFYLNSNGLSGASLQLKSNGSARVRSLYDLEDNSNTYKLDPNATSVLNTLNVTNFSATTINTPNLTSFSLPTNGAVIYLPEISGNSSYTGIAAGNGPLSDGVPWYGGFGREPGGWSFPFPDYVISNHTGIRMAAHGPYGGVSIYDQYNWANGTWSSKGTEVARFVADQAGGSYLTGSLRLGTTLTASGYNPINFNYNGYSTPGGTFRLTPNVHINTPANYGVIINWDNGSTGDASVGQFVVGNGAGGSLFTVNRNAVVSANYFHSWQNDSWFPYLNNWNYFRGYTMAFTQPWFDENDTRYYVDPGSRTNLRDLGALECMMGNCPPNTVFRLTPNLHLNSGTGYGVYLNYDNGGVPNPSAMWQLFVGNGVGGLLFGVRGDNYVYNGGSMRVGQALGVNGYDPYGCGGYGICNGGSAYTQGVWQQGSDIRLKKDITPITGALDRITQLQGVTYRWKDDSKDPGTTAGKHFGFIAQQVEPFIPESVSTNQDGYKAMDYPSITALLTEGIKEQENHINSLQQEFAAFKISSGGELESVKKELNTQKQINDKQEEEINELRDEIQLLKQQIQQPKDR